MNETKEHVLAAGREILLAAQGALRFCKGYVETQIPEPSRPNLLKFFHKAIDVADELSRGICGATSIAHAAGEFAKPLFNAMDREMRAQESASAKPKKTAKVSKGKHRPSSRKQKPHQ